MNHGPDVARLSRVVLGGVVTLAAAIGSLLLLTHLSLYSAWAAPLDGVADRVFGTGGSFSNAACDAGGPTQGLCFPGGVAVDNLGHMYVADAFNNRVLEYNDPLTTDIVPDMVIGQANFSDIACGVGANRLCTPIGVAVDDAGNLYVADKNNSRVLEFDNPVATDAIADRVFGQSDFNGSGCNAGGVSAASLCTPIAVAVDGAGNVYISDDNHRVLEYDTPLSTDTVADRVFGQNGDFTTNGCNLVGLGNPPTASTLCQPAGIGVDLDGNLYVADASNNRVLEYDAPRTSDSVADVVFGQAGSFTSSACNPTMCAPQSVALDAGGNLYVPEGESRVLVYITPQTTDTIADGVIGQPNFGNNGCNAGFPHPDPATVCYPLGATVDSEGNLYVADTSNNRVLEYDIPLGPQTVRRIQGNVDCYGGVNVIDFALLLLFAAGEYNGATPGACPDIGSAVPAAVTGHPWGDVNCDGLVDARDALYVLAFDAGAPLATPQGCTAIGHSLN